MAGFVIYPRLSEDDIRKMAKDSITQVTEWFAKNPDRDDCNAELWYGKQLCIHRSSVAAQINALMEATLKEDNEVRGAVKGALGEVLSTIVDNPQQVLDGLTSEADDGQE